MKRVNFFIKIFIIFILNISSSFSLIEVDITRGNLNPLPIAVSSLSQNENSKNFLGTYFEVGISNVSLFSFFQSCSIFHCV